MKEVFSFLGRMHYLISIMNGIKLSFWKTLVTLKSFIIYTVIYQKLIDLRKTDSKNVFNEIQWKTKIDQYRWLMSFNGLCYSPLLTK